MRRGVWSPLAESELEEILFHIRVRDGRPETARRIGSEIRDAADRIDAQTFVGHTHPDAPAGWYYFRHKRWLIFYRLHADGIEVMRVVDGSRDFPSVLS